MSIPSYVTALVIMSGILVLGLESQEPAAVSSDGRLPAAAAAAASKDTWTEPRAHDNTASWTSSKASESHRTSIGTESAGEKSSTNVITSERAQQQDQFHLDTSKRSGSLPKPSSVIHDNSLKMAPPADTRVPSRTAYDSGDDSVDSTGFPSRLSDLSTTEKKQVLSSLEASFLNIVGLNSRPRPGKSVTIPPYLLDLYKEYTTGRVTPRTRSKPYRSLHGSNTIRSFVHQDEEDKLPEGIAHLKFNVSSVPGDEKLQACELRLYRDASSLENQLQITNSSAGELEELLHSKHRVDVYQVMLPPHPSSGREPVTRLLDTRVVDPTKSGWETFDVTHALESWRTGTKNYGLEVRFSKVTGEASPLRHVRLKRSNRGVLTSHENDKKGPKRNWDSPGPLLVTYTQSPRGSTDKDERHRRDTRRKHRDTTKRSKPKTNRERRKRRKDKPRKDRDYKKNCRRRELYVDFHDVGWTDWIVAPPGYEAFYCYGECPFHLAEHFNTTNHAVVQQFVHSVEPHSVPKACCVPTELSEVALLYIDEENNVVLRRYEEMVVEACGCR